MQMSVLAVMESYELVLLIYVLISGILFSLVLLSNGGENHAQ
jgi:hypothetical protein